MNAAEYKEINQLNAARGAIEDLAEIMAEEAQE